MLVLNGLRLEVVACFKWFEVRGDCFTVDTGEIVLHSYNVQIVFDV